MGLFDNWKSWFICHMFIGYIYLVSGLILNFCMLLAWPIWPLSRSLYRKINAALAYIHWSQITFIGQTWANSKCVLYATPEDEKYFGEENAIILLNHKYDIDWLLGWFVAEHYGMLGTSKAFVKDIFKNVPFIGWTWRATESIFLKRDWAQDQKIIRNHMDQISDYPWRYWILFFPEGTRFTQEKLEASNAVARQKGLPELKHHLLPRTRGFNCTVNATRNKISAIYDAEVGFDTTNYAKPTLLSILYGKEVRGFCHARRIPIEDIPENEEECSKFVHELYREKDEKYEKFLHTGTFDAPVASRESYRPILPSLLYYFWCIVLGVPLVYFIAKLTLFGSVLQRLSVPLIFLLMYSAIRGIILFTETSKGSSYGYKSADSTVSTSGSEDGTVTNGSTVSMGTDKLKSS